MPSQATKKSENLKTSPVSGRPTSLTPDVQKRLCAALSIGLTVEQSCQAVGISPRSYHSWKLKGETQGEPYESFLRAVERATVASVVMCSQTVHEHAREDPRSAQWLLRNRHGWGIEPKGPGIHIHTAGDGSTVNVLASDADTLDRLRALQAKRLGEPE